MPDTEQATKPDTKNLTGKMKKWADAYVLTLNKTEAARRAGYNGNDVTLAQIGYENYRKLEIQEYLKEQFAKQAISSEEVFTRLIEQATGDLGEFTDVQLFTDLKEHPKSHLVKTLTTEVFEDRNGKVHHKMKFELYDAQAALKAIREMRGLDAPTKQEHSGELIFKIVNDDPGDGTQNTPA